MALPTIAAIATPLGSGGIGIVKISGGKSLEIAAALFKRSADEGSEKRKNAAGGADPNFQSHRLYHGYITDPRTGRVVDEVLLAWMQAPHSYTGEDVVEINSHSGTLLMQLILELVLKQGAELAGPGEFSKRAFLNGRMDLTRAEAVNDLICAESESALKIAAAQLQGDLGGCIRRMRSTLIALLAEAYAALDFGEALENTPGGIGNPERLQTEVLQPLAELIHNCREMQYLRSGIEIVIAGAPNVGKSTLMNRLTGEERCIVSPQPGTTRDIVEKQWRLQGLAVRLSDTAGLHKSRDALESIGVGKARQKIKDADLVLALVDASRAPGQSDLEFFDYIEHCSVRALRVVNKIDCEDPRFREKLASCGKSLPSVEISARYGINIDFLKREIIQIVRRGEISDVGQKIVPGLRHRQALEKAQGACRLALEGLQKQQWVEIVAHELEAALAHLGEITGEKFSEEAIERIFSGFCIGK